MSPQKAVPDISREEVVTAGSGDLGRSSSGKHKDEAVEKVVNIAKAGRIESLPTERAIRGQVEAFKQIKLSN